MTDPQGNEQPGGNINSDQESDPSRVVNKAAVKETFTVILSGIPGMKGLLSQPSGTWEATEQQTDQEADKQQITAKSNRMLIFAG